MTRLSVSKAREEFLEVVNRAAYENERKKRGSGWDYARAYIKTGVMTDRRSRHAPLNSPQRLSGNSRS
jgi:hypothetical protein